MTDPALAIHLEQLERELLTPTTRHSPTRLHQLLHPDFREFGSSGRAFTRSTITDLLLAEPASGDLTLHSLTCHRIAPTAALLTYQSQSSTGSALRSSLWTETPQGWQLIFHQGTRVPAP